VNQEERQALIDRARKAKNREVFGDFIRVSESDLYDCVALCPADDRLVQVPQHNPFKCRYPGWCYASHAGFGDYQTRYCEGLRQKIQGTGFSYVPVPINFLTIVCGAHSRDQRKERMKPENYNSTFSCGPKGRHES
jgi:hypothetical protein